LKGDLHMFPLGEGVLASNGETSLGDVPGDRVIGVEFLGEGWQVVRGGLAIDGLGEGTLPFLVAHDPVGDLQGGRHPFVLPLFHPAALGPVHGRPPEGSLTQALMGEREKSAPPGPGNGPSLGLEWRGRYLLEGAFQ